MERIDKLTSSKRTIEHKKSTGAEIQIRVKSVIAMLMQGYSRLHIVQYCSTKFKITPRQTDKYINRAYKEIKDACSDSREEQIALANFRLSDLYQKNYKLGDFRECRSVQESINKMMGFNAPDKIDHTTKSKSFEDYLKETSMNKTLANMTDEELQNKLEELRERMK